MVTCSLLRSQLLSMDMKPKRKKPPKNLIICVQQSWQYDASIHCWHEFMWPLLANGSEILETVPSHIYQNWRETVKDVCPESFQHWLESCWMQQKGQERSHDFPVGMVTYGNSKWVLTDSFVDHFFHHLL